MKAEERIQQEAVIWFRNEFANRYKPRPVILSIPNDMGVKFIKTGLLPGASDLLVVLPNYTLYAECKTPTGTQKSNQKKFEAAVKALGHHYFIFRSLQQFQSKLLQFCKDKGIFDVQNSEKTPRCQD